MRTVVGLGEVLWDVFPDGKRLGGAPANVAYHAENLGEEGVIASRVGDDDLGNELLENLARRELRTDAIQTDPELPTGTVQVTFDDGEPSYEIVAPVAWDNLAWNHELALLATSCDAVAFSTLSQRSASSRLAVTTFLRSMKPGAWRVLDVNLRPPFIDDDVILQSIQLANVVKYNLDERAHIANILGSELVEETLLESLGTDLVILTRGADGCVIQSADGRSEQAGVEVDTSEGDPVGVGDSFVAAVIHELLREAPIDRIAKFANRYAAMVARKRGAMPEMG